jgi:hypothetical protein
MITLPAEIPVTNPPEVTVATSALELFQVPPETDSNKDIELPSQTVVETGVIPVGEGETVTLAVVKQLPME